MNYNNNQAIRSASISLTGGSAPKGSASAVVFGNRLEVQMDTSWTVVLNEVTLDSLISKNLNDLLTGERPVLRQVNNFSYQLPDLSSSGLSLPTLSCVKSALPFHEQRIKQYIRCFLTLLFFHGYKPKNDYKLQKTLNIYVKNFLRLDVLGLLEKYWKYSTAHLFSVVVDDIENPISKIPWNPSSIFQHTTAKFAHRIDCLPIVKQVIFKMDLLNGVKRGLPPLQARGTYDSLYEHQQIMTTKEDSTPEWYLNHVTQLGKKVGKNLGSTGKLSRCPPVPSTRACYERSIMKGGGGREIYTSDLGYHENPDVVILDTEMIQNRIVEEIDHETELMEPPINGRNSIEELFEEQTGKTLAESASLDIVLLKEFPIEVPLPSSYGQGWDDDTGDSEMTQPDQKRQRLAPIGVDVVRLMPNIRSSELENHRYYGDRGESSSFSDIQSDEYAYLYKKDPTSIRGPNGGVGQDVVSKADLFLRSDLNAMTFEDMNYFFQEEEWHTYGLSNTSDFINDSLQAYESTLSKLGLTRSNCPFWTMAEDPADQYSRVANSILLRHSWRDTIVRELISQEDVGGPIDMDRIQGILDIVDKHSNSATVVSVYDPLKSRILTKTQAGENYFNVILQKGLLEYCQSFATFMVNRPLVAEDFINPLTHNAYIPEWWRRQSGDFDNATNHFKMNGATLTFLNGLLSQFEETASSAVIRASMGKKVLHYKSSLMNCLDDPYFKDIIKPAVHGGSLVESVIQVNGQLMGSVLSFPILCLINELAFSLAVFLWWQKQISLVESFTNSFSFLKSNELFKIEQPFYQCSIEEKEVVNIIRYVTSTSRHARSSDYIRSFSNKLVNLIYLRDYPGVMKHLKDLDFSEEWLKLYDHVTEKDLIWTGLTVVFGLRINGDDIYFAAPDSLQSIWLRQTVIFGLKPSLGKNYFVKRFWLMNSMLFTTVGNKPVHIPYINMGLLFGGCKVVHGDDAQEKFLTSCATMRRTLVEVANCSLRNSSVLAQTFHSPLNDNECELEGRVEMSLGDSSLYINDKCFRSIRGSIGSLRLQNFVTENGHLGDVPVFTYSQFLETSLDYFLVFYNKEALELETLRNWYYPVAVGGLGLKCPFSEIVDTAGQRLVATYLMTRAKPEEIMDFQLSQSLQGKSIRQRWALDSYKDITSRIGWEFGGDQESPKELLTTLLGRDPFLVGLDSHLLSTRELADLIKDQRKAFRKVYSQMGKLLFSPFDYSALARSHFHSTSYWKCIINQEFGVLPWDPQEEVNMETTTLNHSSRGEDKRIGNLFFAKLETVLETESLRPVGLSRRLEIETTRKQVSYDFVQKPLYE